MHSDELKKGRKERVGGNINEKKKKNEISKEIWMHRRTERRKKPR